MVDVLGGKMLVRLVLAFFMVVTGFSAPVVAQQATPGLRCEPSPRQPATPAPRSPAHARATPATTGPPARISVGYVPVLIYAPIFVAKEKGYYAEQGLDVTLEPFAGGADPVALTASGQLQAAVVGAGPAFWNAAATGLPIEVVAPGHREGSPVATPLMISTSACESGAISRVADLKGKRVSVNARGATEYWLDQALRTGGLSIDDVDLQTLPFPDAVVALQSGAIDAAMVGEPLATKAERDGIAVRLAADFPVQDVTPTVLLANRDFAAANPKVIQGLVTAYVRAARDLSGGGLTDPANLAIVESYTKVPATLVADAVLPVFPADGALDPASLGKLQAFFRDRGQLRYDADLDPASLIDRRFLDAALAALGPLGP